MAITGKGMFVWRVRFCEGGDVNAIADMAVQSNFAHILVKVADGNFNYNIDTKTGADYAATLIAALKSRKIKVYGWHYVYGYAPLVEADRAIIRINQLGLDGYVIDAEAEYKGNDTAARTFMQKLRASLPNYPIGFSSYRYPSLHPTLPWKEFLPKCDFIMPQVYWLNSYNPGAQLRKSVLDFQKIGPALPIIPTGPLFKYGQWAPTVEQIQEFFQAARDLNLPGINFWEWSKCRQYLPHLWDYVKTYTYGTPSGQDDIVWRFMHTLNLHDPADLIKLYRTDAIHVTQAHAIQGQAQLSGWYQKFFSQILPGGSFQLSNYTGQGSVRHLNWTATSSKGKVQNGSDTFGLVNDKIAYHYTQFSVN